MATIVLRQNLGDTDWWFRICYGPLDHPEEEGLLWRTSEAVFPSKEEAAEAAEEFIRDLGLTLQTGDSWADYLGRLV